MLRLAGFTLIQLMGVVAIIAILGALAVPSYTAYVDRARVARAISEIGDIEIAVKQFEARDPQGLPPSSLNDIGFGGATDPWGNPYLYTNLLNGGVPRVDQYGDPVNQEYDLLSTGQDGATALALTSANAQDDIVRGNDGTYLGLVSDYPRLP
jgi:general secretion pathway protein G